MSKPRRRGAACTTAKALARSSHGYTASDVTPLQYGRAWDLISTGHSIPQVMAGTGLTKPQLAWLMRHGDDSAGMPSYSSRLLEQASTIRKRARDAAEEVGQGGLEAIKRQLALVKLSQQIANLLLQEVGRSLAENAKLGDDDRKPLHRVIPSKQVTETLRILRPYTSVVEVAVAFRQIYDSPYQKHDPLSGLPRDTVIDLSHDTVVPASLALLEGIRNEEESNSDIIDSILPEFHGWTDGEREHFANTGERPDSDYDLPGPRKIPQLDDVDTDEAEVAEDVD